MIGLGMVAASFILAGTSLCQQDSIEELKKQNAELKKQFGTLQEKVESLNTKLELYETKQVPPGPKGAATENEMMPDGDNPLLTAFKDAHLSGFVDMGYVFSFNSLHASSGASVTAGTANAGGNPIRTFDTHGNAFYLNHAQLMVEKVATDKMILGYRVKLDAGNDPFLFDGQTLTCEEGYIEFLVPMGTGLDIKAGKMATLAGAEVIEAKDDMNYSRGILFGFAIPFTHTGIRTSYAFNDKIKTTLGFNNGWNLIAGPGALAPANLNTFVDSNHGKTLEYQLEVKPLKELTLDATLYVGDENGTTPTGNTAYATQYVADLVANFSIGKVTLVANFDWGAHENDLGTGKRAAWSGIAGYAKYQFSDVFASSIRAEYFSDHDGRIAGPAPIAADSGTGARYFEFTLTEEFKVAGTAIVRVEIRHDDANNHVFTRDSKPARGDNTLGFEAILPF
jgi:hypothetical protein